MSEINIDQYTVLKLDDGGKYGFKIIEGWINRDGEFKPSWVKREFGKAGEKTEKTVPASVKLGDKDKAIEALTLMLAELQGDDPF